MKLNNKTYDILKWVSLVLLPSLITFIGVVMNCFNLEYTDIVLTIMVAFNTFLGTVLGVSNIQYNKGEE